MAYIYEHIRTQGFEPMHFEEHYTRLDALARSLFLAPLAVAREELQKRVAECLRSADCSPCVTNAVCVRYYADGKLEVEVAEMWYDSFSLRALRPQGYLCRVSGELLLQNTSAKEALIELNRTTAQMTDEGVAVWVDEQGEILAIDGVSVIAVFEDEIRFSRLGAGVEFELAYKVATAMKRNVTRCAIMADELLQVKELLCVDYRGVTAIAGYNGHFYMDILAEKIASKVAKEER